MSDAIPAPQWPATWSRAALGTAVLASLEAGSLHGYGIAQAVQARGFGRPKGGSLYPLLASLEAEGAVSTAWEEGNNGPGRRNYTLTDGGRQRLADERQAWKQLAVALEPDNAGGENR